VAVAASRGRDGGRCGLVGVVLAVDDTRRKGSSIPVASPTGSRRAPQKWDNINTDQDCSPPCSVAPSQHEESECK
jgi:hypothetical protein